MTNSMRRCWQAISARRRITPVSVPQKKGDPVLVTRDIGPVDAVKESALLLKQTWGENLVGQGGVGLIFGLAQVGWWMLIGSLIVASVGSGSAGCDSTGAIMAGSTASDSAKFPVRHIPIAPTPVPPSSAWTLRTSARSQSVTGASPSRPFSAASSRARCASMPSRSAA